MTRNVRSAPFDLQAPVSQKLLLVAHPLTVRVGDLLDHKCSTIRPEICFLQLAPCLYCRCQILLPASLKIISPYFRPLTPKPKVNEKTVLWNECLRKTHLENSAFGFPTYNAWPLWFVLNSWVICEKNRSVAYLLMLAAVRTGYHVSGCVWVQQYRIGRFFLCTMSAIAVRCFLSRLSLVSLVEGGSFVFVFDELLLVFDFLFFFLFKFPIYNFPISIGCNLLRDWAHWRTNPFFGDQDGNTTSKNSKNFSRQPCFLPYRNIVIAFLYRVACHWLPLEVHFGWVFHRCGDSGKPWYLYRRHLNFDGKCVVEFRAGALRFSHKPCQVIDVLKNRAGSHQNWCWFRLKHMFGKIAWLDTELPFEFSCSKIIEKYYITSQLFEY